MANKKSQLTKMNECLGYVDLEHPENYHPWILSRELTTGMGKRHILTDPNHLGRRVHLMSNLEFYTYKRLRENSGVKEVFEQYPLDVLITTRIARGLGITHPRMPFSDKPLVMTTDFLVLYEDENKELRLQAFAVKTSSDLMKLRTREKLTIEKMYWAEHDIEWAIMTEDSVSF